MMDELDLARRAVRRGSLSEEQLREAQSFASGGRSLLAVLLDLGYLRPKDVADLTQVAPAQPAARSATRTLFVILFTAAVTAFAVKSCEPHAPQFFRESPPTVIHQVTPIGPVLLDKALQALSEVDDQVKRTGALLDAPSEKRVRHAAELLEEAMAQGSDPLITSTALGRAHELLDHWETAAEWYRKAIHQEERDPGANLGLARVLLLLDRPLQAHTYATTACQAGYIAEAYLVRAKANMNLGNKREARTDLDLALKRDPGLRVAVRALQQRLDE